MAGMCQSQGPRRASGRWAIQTYKERWKRLNTRMSVIFEVIWCNSSSDCGVEPYFLLHFSSHFHHAQDVSNE
jgi:hypothetical protein